MDETKQQRNPYRWDYTIRVRTRDGMFEYEPRPKEKVRTLRRSNTGVLYAIRNSKTGKR